MRCCTRAASGVRVQEARQVERVRVSFRATGAAALLQSSVHGMVQAKVIRVVREVLGGAVSAFREPQTPPVSLSTTSPEGVIHQLRQHRIQAAVAVLELDTLSRPT